ncbi:DNA recombination protein RecN [Micromonospora echinospora]|uniref:DNA recombination protein RecN n=1 Tax=Micromonospora echinospora TaxID=1877 RepID=UPI0033ECD9F4
MMLEAPVPDHSTRGIRIRRLRLHGADRHYDVDFVDEQTNSTRSLSVIAGAISTGKTTVLEFIDYCLGAGEHPHHPEVISKVTAATIEVSLSGIPHLIERSVGEPSSHAFIRPGQLDDGGGPPAERRLIKPAGNPDSLSSLLLAHCGLEGVLLREAPTQDNSGTDPLSFRDLMWLCFLPNEQVASKNLLFENHNMKKIKLRQVVDVVFDVHDDRAADLGRRIKELEVRLARSRATYEAAQQIVEEQRLGSRMELEIALDRANEEKRAAERALEVLDQRTAATTDFAEELRVRYQSAAAEARRTAALVRDRETQLRRMMPLRSQYADDVAKLTMLGEAHQLFDPLRVRVCPACLSTLGRAIEVEDGSCGLCRNVVATEMTDLASGQAAHGRTLADRSDANSSLPRHGHEKVQEHGPELPSPVFDVSAELRATKKRLTELTRFVDELDAELKELKEVASRARDAEARAAAEVDNATTRAISPFLAERDALSRRRQEATAIVQRSETGLQMVQSLERRAGDVIRQEGAIKALREELATATNERVNRSVIVRRIGDRFASILEAWKYPKLSDVYLNDELTPFVRNLRYTAASSGGRTLISLAWMLAIFEVAWEAGAAHPGFIFLDSPQKNLGQTGERDAEFADTVTIADFYRHLHAWLAGPGVGAQVVLVDNAPPPEAADDVILRFSRRVDQPPYGLIDDATG